MQPVPPHTPAFYLPWQPLQCSYVLKKTHWCCPFLFAFWILGTSKEISSSSAASLLSLAQGRGNSALLCSAVCAHYQHRKESSCLSYPFRWEAFSVAEQLKYILSPNCIHHRCFFLQINSATLKQLSFCKQNGFSSLIWETAVIQITSLKSLPLPNFFESQLTHNNTKWEWN